MYQIPLGARNVGTISSYPHWAAGLSPESSVGHRNLGSEADVMFHKRYLGQGALLSSTEN